MSRLSNFSTGLDAARVVNWRLGNMGRAAIWPGAQDGSEMIRMVAEKQTAFFMGLFGAQQAMVNAWMSGSLDMHKVAADITAAAEAPALKTLNGNVRRIRSKRR